ncbi:hypothetical protein [Alkalihalobacterium bogoriense]|uniref:hypothetical protein n=1 Tax=Alkalihalobacterium bogoriense TaxID=246272 RepID=UPI00047E9083|nr:hypothetical protein [Alkalihalobacterium bogoriense]
MLLLQVVIALLIGRRIFYSFVRKDPLFIQISRYVGFIGITLLFHIFLGPIWTWFWIIGFPLIGLLIHYIFVKVKGFSFINPGEDYDKYRGWK